MARRFLSISTPCFATFQAPLLIVTSAAASVAARVSMAGSALEVLRGLALSPDSIFASVFASGLFFIPLDPDLSPVRPGPLDGGVAGGDPPGATESEGGAS